MKKKKEPVALEFIVDNSVLVFERHTPFRLNAIQTVLHNAGNTYISVLFAGIGDLVNVGFGTEERAKWAQATLAEWMSKQPRER